jgi:hypothetical protein
MNKCDMKWMSLTEMHKKKKFHVKLIHLNKGKFDELGKMGVNKCYMKWMSK